MMTKLLASLSVLSVVLGGCVGTVVDPDETVATYTLKADLNKALVVQECIQKYAKEGGEQACTPYPNALECDTMKVAIKADGRIHMECVAAGKLLHFGLVSSPDEVPFMCKANAELSCQVCVDLYGNTIHDNCNRNAQAFRQAGSGWGNVPEGSAFLEDSPQAPGVTPPTTPDTTPSTPSTPTTPAPGSDDVCKPSNAILLYAKELNKILAHEGLNFSWAPNTAQFPDANQGFFGYKGSGSNTSCEAFLAGIKSKLHKCISGQAGTDSCKYCWNSGSKKTCKCYRVNVAAMKAACQQVPANCDKPAWSANLIMSYGIATKWLFSPSYTNFYGQVNGGNQTAGGPGAVPGTPAIPTFPKCEGSPLVLDLGDDGIDTTSAQAGVRFDLLGVGPMQTAWLAGGKDALLALDRNGNGQIDGGAELFGEATANQPHENGFEALAALDSNKDGKLDRRDAMWSKLVLWSDANGDGRSDVDELSTLGAKKVRSLDLRAMSKAKRDRHGNDLGLQGSFTRTDGSRGLMVDVYFVNR
jgi:hypothetical protein